MYLVVLISIRYIINVYPLRREGKGDGEGGISKVLMVLVNELGICFGGIGGKVSARIRKGKGNFCFQRLFKCSLDHRDWRKGGKGTGSNTYFK